MTVREAQLQRTAIANTNALKEEIAGLNAYRRKIDAENGRLRAENKKLREDRDLWKISEETCNQNYNELLQENEQLRAVNKQMLEALKLIYENKYEGDKLFIYCGRQVKDAIKAGEEVDD